MKISDFENQQIPIKEMLTLISAPILVCHPTTQKIIFSNEAASDLFSYLDQNLSELSLVDVIAPQSIKIVNALIDLATQSEEKSRYFERGIFIQRKSKRQIETDLQAGLMKTSQGSLLVFIFHDLSEIRKQQNEKNQLLEASLQLSKLADVGRLAAGIAHELNNPLSILLGYTENLRSLADSGQLTPEEIKLNLAPIEKSAERMAKLISKMLTSLRQQEVKLQKVDLKSIVHDSVEFVKAGFKNNPIDISVEVDSMPVIADPLGIEQVITNLMTNASDALENQTERKIRIKGHIRNNRAYLEVWNSGDPIPPEVQKHLFTPFISTKPQGKGTGLGLYMSFQIIKSHHGELKFESKEKLGTRFYMDFPIAA